MKPRDFLTTVQETVTRYAMFAPGQTVVVGVSGGPDSMALLHALVTLRETWGVNLVAAHLHHGIRGAEADEDAAYVERMAAQFGVTAAIERRDIPAVRKARHLSMQVAAREARHAFLRRVATEVSAERIALGHTRDDRVETVLLNLLRGSGLEGLAGFPPVQMPLVRPLYEVRRAETEAYCTQQHLQPRIDSSNLKPDYRRNRIRAELLPSLMSYYNEEADEAILRMAELAAADNRFLEAIAAETLPQITMERTGTQVVLSASALQELPLALQRRTLRQALAEVRGHLQDIGFLFVERIRGAVEAGQKLSMQLPHGMSEPITVTVAEGYVRIQRTEAPVEVPSWQVTLNFPGRTELPVAGLVVEAERVAAGEAWTPGEPKTEDYVLLFPAQDVTLPLIARCWQPGDRMRPRGMQGTKKLQDLFTDRKIPREARRHVPVIVDAGGSGRILAVGDLHVAERGMRLAAGTVQNLSRTEQEMLRLRIAKIHDRE